LAAAGVAAAAGYEAPPSFKASQLLPASVVKGAHHAIEEGVAVQGLQRQYRVTSDYGAFVADRDSQIPVLLKEVDALQRLSETSQSEVALKAVGGTISGAAKGAAHAASKPKETIAGVPGGVGRMFGRAGKSAKRAADNVKDEVKQDDKSQPKSEQAASSDSAAEAAAKKALGISAGRRRWAKELGVDPYTTNPALSSALDKVGQIDAVGRFSAKLVPGVKMLSTVATVNALVYEKAPAELVEHNQARLQAMGVPEPVRNAFRRNPYLLPGLQTRIVAALDSLTGVAERGEFVEQAVTADSPAGAVYFADAAEMLARFHATQAKLTSIVPARAAAIALTQDGRLVHLVPADYVGWTQPVAEAVEAAVARAKSEQPKARPELWITGDLSAQARKELESRGWKAQAQALRPAGLFPGAAVK
jgi:hypothetical protein